MKRVLLLATTTGYQTRMFGEAAEKLGVRLVFATDRCDQLEDPWWDAAVPIRFQREAESLDVILRALGAEAADGIVVVGDRPTVIAARVAQAFGLPGHPPEAAAIARNKRLTRARMLACGLPVPRFRAVPFDAPPETLADSVCYPCVIKPAVLSGSRGVMRVNGPEGFVPSFRRLHRLLSSRDVRALHDDEVRTVLIEDYIEGREYAFEGVLERGVLRPLALFDKPDPLEGPFFEETLYVTPSVAGTAVQADIVAAVAEGARALGLSHGPVHAECRVNAKGVFLLEIAARPIGGLCARALTFIHKSGRLAGLEELLLRHALGESLEGWTREARAAGVMMIPIAAGGIYRGVEGLEDAESVTGIREVRITAKVGQQLVPLPEGASYLGFIFANADTSAEVREALRASHSKLRFGFAPRLVMASGL